MFTPDNLPNLLKQLEDFKSHLTQAKPANLWKYLDDCQGALQKVQESLTDPKQKEILGELLSKAAVARKEVQDQVPALLEGMKQQHEQSMAFIKEHAAKIEQTEKEFKDKLNAEAELAASLKTPAPAQPLPAVEANHGATLAVDFLQSMGLLDAASKEKAFDDLGSVARHWSETDAGDSVASTPTPAPAVERPTLKPRSATPLRRPPRETKPAHPKPNLDESIGHDAFEDQ